MILKKENSYPLVLNLICHARIGGGQKWTSTTPVCTLHIVGIIEKYDHIQTGLEKKIWSVWHCFFGYLQLQTDLVWCQYVWHHSA